MPDEDFDPSLIAEIVTMTDDKLGWVAGRIVFELATGYRGAGIGHIEALNRIVAEAAKRRVALG